MSLNDSIFAQKFFANKKKYVKLLGREIRVITYGRRSNKTKEVTYYVRGEIIALKKITQSGERLFFRVPHNDKIIVNILESLGVEFSMKSPFLVTKEGVRFKQGLFYERVENGYEYRESITE